MRLIWFVFVVAFIGWMIERAVRRGVLAATKVNDADIEQKTTLPFDREKWLALEKYDPEIATIASKLRVLGDKWVDEFARAYLALSDKKYLPNIVHKIIEDARLEAKELEQKLEQKKMVRKDAWSSLAFILSLFALAGLIVAVVGIGGKIWSH
jgi:hypothetical protein